MTTEPKSTSDCNRRRFLELAGGAGAGAMVAAAGCAGDQGTATESPGDGGGGTDEATPTPERKTGGTLIAGTQSDVGKLDPHLTQSAPTLRMLRNVYQTLTIIDEDLKPVSQLATDWEVSDDGLTWTMSLREGVTFHPPVSRELTADDVVYSLERIMDEETGSPWRSNFTPVAGVSADGDHTVVFEFDEPYAPFLVKLTSGFVMPAGAADADEYDLEDQPVGTGPFVFEEHVTQTKTVLSGFDDYWETDESGNQLPYLDGVELQPFPEGQSRITNLKTGQVDWVVTVPRSQASQLQGASGVVFSNKAGTFYDYIGQNTAKAPLDDVKLRQAISWAVDREAIAKGARFGFAQPTQDPISPASAWEELITVDDPYEQDLEKASQLVGESSYDGEELAIKVGQSFNGQVNEAEIIQEQLQGANIDATVQPMEFGSLISDLNEGNFHLTVIGWIGFTDPDDLFFLEFHSGEAFNQTSYSNDEVDELLEKGRHATGTREERAEFYDDAVDIIAREAPYTFLVYNEEVAAWRDYVKGFVHIPTGTPRFKTVWLDE